MPANHDSKITKQQTAICESHSKMLIVEANAGAGKTTTAAMKIARMIENGAEPSKIVALTYTEPAVQAFYDAFRRLKIKTSVADKIKVGTFEDFCASRLQKFENLTVPRLSSPEQVRAEVLYAISQARVRAVSKGYGSEFTIIGKGELAVEGLLNDFAYIKGSLFLVRDRDRYHLSPSYASDIGKSFTSLSVFDAFENRRCGFVDNHHEPRARHRFVGDSTYDMACLFETDDPIYTLENHPLRLGLQAIVVDEMHDLNWSMFTVLRELLAKNENAKFLGIGDRDQVLHAITGAESGFMNDIFQQYVGTPQTLELSKTFRFGSRLSEPLARFSKKAYLSHEDRITQIEVKETITTDDVLASIQSAIDQRRGLAQDSPNSEIAVLLRKPASAVELEHQLRRKAIKYSTRGFTSYLERPEVLFIRLLLSHAVKLPEKFSQDMFRRAVVSTWYFIDGTLPYGEGSPDISDKVMKECDPFDFFRFTLPELLRNASSKELAEQIQTSLDIAQSDNIEHLPQAIEVLDIEKMARQSFVQVAAMESMLSSVKGLIRSARGYQSISAFLRAMLMYDRDANADAFTDDRILLASIEAVKGLEYEHVLIPDVNTREFDGSSKDESNLFYVAATRAKNTLTLMHRPKNASSYLACFQAS
jgi:DNA helicase II / ATP-dependent DNA helicase PcrA